MAVTYVGVSATATPAGTLTTAGTAAVSPSLPAGTASGDRVFLYQASSNTSGTAPTGWTQLYKDVQVGVTGTAPGAGTGRRYISAYWRDYDGAWTMPTLTLTSATQNSNAAAAMTLHKDTGDTWDTPTFSSPGHDTTSGTGWSVTIPSFTTVAGAVLMTHSGHTAGGGSASGQNLTQTGATIANVIERYDNGTTTGNDVRLVFGTATVTTGATATLTRTATLSVAGTGGTCVVQQTVTAAPTVPQGPEQTMYVYPTAFRGDGATVMTNGGNALADDGTYATVSVTQAAAPVAYSWDMPAIPALPSDATFVRADMQIEMRLNVSTSGVDTYPEVYTAGFATRIANPVITAQPTVDTVVTGATSMALAQLSAATIWLQSHYGNTGAATVSIDFVRYAIVYTQPASTGQDLQATASSAAGATDSVSTALTAQRSAVDTAGAVDTVSTALTASRAATDTAGATDTATWSVAGTPGAGETFGITGTSTTLSGLTPGKKYTLQVRSREPQSVSAWSDPVEFTTTTALPTGVATGSLASTDSTTVLNADARMGINSNLWLDNDAQRTNGARGLQAALGDLKPKIIRYPGGEKSDGTIFFQAVNQGAAGQAGPNPRLSRIGDNAWPSNDPTYWTAATAAGTWAAGRPPYALTTFLTHCQAVGAEPLLVVALDSIYSNVPTGAGIKPTKAQIITNAQEFVRWCNVTNSYNVRYWEIGNEPWLVNADYFGGTADPTQYAADFADVAAAMKAIDPTIKVGANGDSVAYFDGILNTAAASVDFLSVHPYDTYQMPYATFQTATLTINQLNSAVTSLNKQPAQHRDRIWITATETAHLPANNTDTLAINNLGSAIITAHYLGLQLRDSRLRHVIFWNSRWIYNTQATKMAYDAFAPDNTLLPVGRALQFLGQLSGRLVTASSGFTGVEVYASQVVADARSSVLIVNRSSTARAGTVGMTGAASVTVRQLTGTGPTDTAPALNTLSGVTVTGGVTSSVSCPANSLTLLDFGY